MLGFSPLLLAVQKLTPEQFAQLDEADLKIIQAEVERLEAADPVLFSRRILKFEPWARQAEVMRAIVTHDRVAVRSGHKIGKSAAAAAIALWWFHTKPNSLVVMTSSTDDQVRLILWAELKRMYRKCAEAIGGDIHDSHRVGLIHRDGRRIVGIGTNKSENMAGFSGRDLLFVVDEASGVDDEIFDAVEGNRAGGAKVIMFGNPTRQVGRFYDAFHYQSKFWKTLHISSEETPNAISGKILVPGLATKEYIEEKRAEYGADSPWYQVRVKGDFPDRGEDSVLGLDLVAGAWPGWREPEEFDGILEIGVDVARFGDDETVIFPRRGLYAYPPTVLSRADVVKVSQAVKQVVKDLGVPGERVVVRVDGCGVGGGVVDILQQSLTLEVIDVNAGRSAKGQEHARLRDQLWFNLRNWLQAGGKLMPDAKLEGELLAPTYSFDLKGRLKVESKDDLREKLRPRRSPDRADALALAVYDEMGVAAAAFTAPPYLDEAPDPAQVAIERRLEEICSG